MLPKLCTVCSGQDLKSLVSFGLQPLSTHFSQFPESRQEAERHLLSFGVCRHCGTMQLVDRFPLGALQEKNPKVQFREPRGHLSKVVDVLLAHKVFREYSSVLGLSYIDADLLEMLPVGKKSPRIVLHELALPEWGADIGLETMQAVLCKTETLERVLALNGVADFLSARFILEHAESANRFLKSLRGLVKPGGYLLIEVPDASKIIRYQNHALIWEDHFTYFVSDTLLALANSCGLEIVCIDTYSYPHEDVLSLLARVPIGNMSSRELYVPSIQMPNLDLAAFAASYAGAVKKIHKAIESKASSNGGIAIFGAGHHASKFVNFYGLGKWLQFAVDDNRLKAGLFLPGTDLKVKTSEDLLASDVSLCISTLSPEGECKVRSSLPSYFSDGRDFYSAFFTGVT